MRHVRLKVLGARASLARHQLSSSSARCQAWWGDQWGGVPTWPCARSRGPLAKYCYQRWC
eukprot:3599191-Alexandrium_andersonii.AAC.1